MAARLTRLAPHTRSDPTTLDSALLISSTLAPRASPAFALAKHSFSRSMSAQPPKSEKLIELYSTNTPNGLKVNVALEGKQLGSGWTTAKTKAADAVRTAVCTELIAAGSPVTYAFHPISLMKDEQKEPWFLALNPNGRVTQTRFTTSALT